MATLAQAQRGRVNRRQLLAAGLASSQITRLIAAGRLFQLHAGVYAVGHPADVPLGRETAALLSLRDGALLSHLTAVRLWGLDTRAPDPGAALDGDVHVLIDRRWARPRPGVRTHRSRIIAPADRCVRERLPVASPARALLDLVVDLEPRRLDRIYEAGLIAGVIATRGIEELLGRAEGHPGQARLRELAHDHAAAGVTRSEAEERLLALVGRAELATPRVNARLHGYEVDFLWPQASLVVEVDGYRFHSTRAAFERDRVRDARLQAAGIEVLRVTWRQLERDALAVVARIAGALARRTPATR
jgi:very-short-patch-repair endonuclease